MRVPSAAERRSHVLRLLQDQGHASVSALSDELGVTEVTIRKDLRYLEEHRQLVRTHGGAMPIDHYAYDLPFEEKATRNAEQKRRIGKAAADLVEDDDTIILDSGTTALQVARNLRGKQGVTAVTGSIHIATELLRMPNVDLILLGGIVRSTSASAMGPTAEQMLREHSFRKLFLAGDGLDLSYGLTTTHTLEAHLNKVMIQSAEQTIVIVDSSKFGRRGLSLICGVHDINTVITDEGVSEAVVKQLEEEGVKVIIA